MAGVRTASAARTVVVADDHPIVISGLRLVFAGSRFFDLVGEAGTGSEAILRCAQLRPDVLLLDLRLPDLPASTICARVKEIDPSIQIVILTAHPEEMAVRGCIKAGASGCLFKDTGEQRLLGALMQVVNGREVYDPRVAGARVPRSARAADRPRLTEREQQVLTLIARGLNTQEIGDQLDLSPNTIKSHTRALFTKLDAHNRVQALSMAQQRGLL